MSAFSEIAALAKEIRAGFPDVGRDLRRDRKNAPAELLERAARYRKKLERLATLVCDHLPKLTLVEPILRVVVRKSGPELESLSVDDLERLDDDLSRIEAAAIQDDAISPVERLRDRIQLVVTLACSAERKRNALHVEHEAAVALRVAIETAYRQCPQVVSADVAKQIERDLDECEEAAGDGERERTLEAFRRLREWQRWLRREERYGPTGLEASNSESSLPNPSRPKWWLAPDARTQMKRTDDGWVLTRDFPMFNPDVPTSGFKAFLVQGSGDLLTPREALQWFVSHGMIVPDELLDATDGAAAPGAANRETTTAPPEATQKKRAKNRGRPRDTNATADQRIYDAYKRGHFETYEDFARQSPLVETAYDVKLVMDRVRKRKKRRTNSRRKSG